MENNNFKNGDKLPISYLRKFQQLRNDMLQGDATWNDIMLLRDDYQLPYLSADSLRRGVKIYDEFNMSGWINEPNGSQASFPNISRETTELLKDGNISSDKLITLLPDKINDPKALLEAHGFNPLEFELVSAKNSKWQQGKETKYASKIVVKPVANTLKVDELAEYFKTYKTEHKVDKANYSNYTYGAESLIICMYDVHFGRFSDPYVTGTKYNLEIAKNRMKEGVQKYLERFKNRKFEEIILPIGQDFFNSNYDGVTTQHKNKQDNAGDFNTIFKAGTEALIDVIDMLANFAPVKIISVPGNHGYVEDQMLCYFLSAYDRNDKRVVLDVDATPRKYHVFGKSLIGLTHGSDEIKQIWTLMQAEVPGYWAMTDEHIFLIGHIHHLKVEENNGLIVWNCSAVTEPDAWTIKKGYVSKARLMSFVFDKSHGLVETHYVNYN